MASEQPISVNQTGAARVLGISDRTLRRWDRAGTIRGARVNGVRFYLLADLRRLATTGKANAEVGNGESH